MPRLSPPKRSPAPHPEENVPVAQVYVEKSFTQNLGDFNSAKITVGVVLPLNPSGELLEDVHDAITVAINVVDDRLAEELDKLDEL